MNLGEELQILIDSREKLKLNFNQPYISGVKIQKLDCGDYMVELSDGHIPPVSFERKELGDLFGTLSQGYTRFKKELIRAKNKELQIIIIVKGTLTEVLQGYKYSKRRPEQIVQQLFTLLVKYNIWPVFLSTEKEMSDFIYYYACAYARKRLKDQKCPPTPSKTI